MRNYKALYGIASMKCCTNEAWEWEKKYAVEILEEILKELKSNYRGDDWYGFNWEINKLNALLKD